jgi:APA family basic amino acid/polyamine antiporter
VPPNAPIDAAMPEAERRAASIIDSARVRGGRRVTGHWEKVRPGQAGRRIVEEARDIKARALVMPLPPRRTGASLFGKTLETVLAERPCRVIIQGAGSTEPTPTAA